MSIRDFALFITMPVWLPIVVLGSVFLIVMGLPVVFYGPLYLIGKYGYLTVGSWTAFGMLALSIVSFLVHATRNNETPALSRNPSIECTRCRNLDPNNLKGGKFSCTVCGYQT